MLDEIFSQPLPIIGMVHLPPLLGYRGCPGMRALVRHVREEVEILEAAGYDGVLVENENDQPHQVTVRPEIIAAMSIIAGEAVAASRKIVIGVEILLNDPKASLAAAHAAGARFIRTDYFVDRMARDEYGGEMLIDAPGLMRYRREIGADAVAVLADIQVKYARMLEPRPLGASARLARDEGADGLIVTGQLTGQAPVVDDLDAARAAVAKHPVLIGSGLSPENAQVVLPHATGAIVGTGIMTKGGRIDRRRAEELMATVRQLREGLRA